ncbi:MAG: biotin transporter BioY, partial [Candidatus Eremiobacteraeota bacterium]|nr:biotin transporter BioY [Candidatus Eremiobacteraeota bacterium]
RTYPQRFAAVFVGTSVVFIGGAAWLTAFFTHDLGRAVAVGVLPFLIGDVAKCLVAAGLRPRSVG